MVPCAVSVFVCYLLCVGESRAVSGATGSVFPAPFTVVSVANETTRRFLFNSSLSACQRRASTIYHAIQYSYCRVISSELTEQTEPYYTVDFTGSTYSVAAVHYRLSLRRHVFLKTECFVC